MTVANFAPSLKRVLVYEGGKVNDPRDPGGKTNQGVIQRVYNGYRANIGKPPGDVYDMTTVERDAIYKRQFWDAIKGDRLPAGVDFAVFDGAVNSGSAQSVKWLQRALGITADGQMGEVTVDAAIAYPDHDKLIAAICDRRLAFMKALKIWSIYKGGWSARVAQVRKTGQAWASGSVEPNPIAFTGANKKATIDQAKSAPTKGPADAATGGGIVSGGVGTALESARSSLEPLTGTSNIIANIVVALVVAGVVLTAGGFAYGWFQRRREAERVDALDLTPVPAAPLAPEPEPA